MPEIEDRHGGEEIAFSGSGNLTADLVSTLSIEKEMKMDMNATKTIAVLSMIGLVLFAAVPTVNATVTPGVTTNPCPPGCGLIDFEDGTEGAQIVSQIPGVVFTATAGYTWNYGDALYYNTHSLTDPGYGSGTYVVNGHFFAWLGVSGDQGRIDFTEGTASYFSVLTSTNSGLAIDAYDSGGNFLATSGWASGNLGSNTFTRLTVETPDIDIAYVIVHDTGNYWLIDDIVTDAPGVGNEPPVAVCQGAVVAVGEVPDINGGSHDPDGDPITLSQSPPGAFDEAGIYEVTLTVTDSAGASDSCTAMVVVYDPSAGFVTGGGWIDSPEGAYTPDPLLVGKANFGFVSKYKKGASLPTGQTEFQFHAGDLNFHSSSYDWLVVTGSNYARFKGLGTVNGMANYSGTLSSADNYKFMLWAGDAPDTFRIKIWWEDDDDAEHVVYDNGMDQLIGGGSIVVHAKQTR